MKKELDDYLCNKYPKIFADRNKDMQETCMCWGFDHGNGWFNIIDQLCANIQHHIDWTEQSFVRDTEYNQMIEDCKSGNWVKFEEYYKGWNPVTVKQRRVEIVKEKRREVKEPCPQVVAEQVKEKFGTLRFYYRGGDEYISGLVSMAESMSGVTCDECGNPAETGGQGWISTRCNPCKDRIQKEREKVLEDYKNEKV